MIVRLTGLLAELDEESVVVERDGLAYEVLVAPYTLAELAACRGQRVTLHTIDYLEGNPAGGNMQPRIVGFLHAEDRAFFRIFTTVKGIGLRKGLRALAEPAARIAQWIEAGDTATLAKLPGIGKKAAQQIVAELRGKLDAFRGAGAPAALPTSWSDGQRDAIDVLVAWGDPRQDAERWVARAAQLHPELSTADEWVRAAYRIRGGAEG
ncbi:MAG: Holliday junction branch migration protein RuvA [Phycisphaerae bacterium]|nr:Holliday junction branch migration protein RuvA [Phycisphaerae bacterium]